MGSWRDRLCGSQVADAGDEETAQKLEHFLNPSESVSCGGGFFPTVENMANQTTFKKHHFVLPTKQYSVLVFKEDGSAVIYSDSVPQGYEEDNDTVPPFFSA